MSERIPINDDSEQQALKQLDGIGKEVSELEREIEIFEEELKDALARAEEGALPPKQGMETPRDAARRLQKELGKKGMRLRMLREEAGRIRARLAKE